MTTPEQPDYRGWTIHALRVYLERILDERDKRYDQRFEAQENAIHLATAAFDREQLVESARLASVRAWIAVAVAAVGIVLAAISSVIAISTMGFELSGNVDAFRRR